MSEEISVTTLLQQLIRIPSVTPDDARDPSEAGEARMAAHLETFLRRRGFHVERLEIMAGRPNVIARYPCKHPRKTVLFEAHMDTVSVKGMTIDPFGGELRNGRIYGRGATDVKGPMAAVLSALTPELLQQAAAKGVQIIFVGMVDEEKGCQGAEDLAQTGFGADMALIMEPTNGCIINAHRGVIWCWTDLYGQAGHGSQPEQGVSTVEALAIYLQELYADMDTAQQAHSDRSLGRPTLNIGRIDAGSGINIIPDHCRLACDRRFVPAEDPAAIQQGFCAPLDRLKAEGKLIDYKVVFDKTCPTFHTPADSLMIQLLKSSLERHTDGGDVCGSSWYSDAGPLSRTCREIAVYGPGSIAQAHTADEYIEVDELERGRAVIHTFLHDLLRNDDK